MKSKLRGQRLTVSIYFVVLVVIFPLSLIALREVAEALLEATTWDNTACNWIDKTLQIPAFLPHGAPFFRRVISGSSHRWLTDIITVPLAAWTTRFLSGSIEEIRHTHGVTPLEIFEIFCRWVALSLIIVLSIPILSILFFRVLMKLTIWEPIALLISTALFFFLWFWSYQYPNRRLKQAEKVYNFKQLKRDADPTH